MAKRLIDATEAKEWAEKHILDAKERYTILGFLRECSTVDAVEVVRCSQCVNYCFNKRGEYMYCDYWDVDDYHEAIVHEDDFCSYGERRDEA